MSQESKSPWDAFTDAGAIWEAVNRCIDSIADLATLEANRIHLLAATRWRTLGREVPTELQSAERRAALVTLVGPALLTEIRDVIETPLVLHKGPEIAARYPDPALRYYTDLDVLVRDAQRAQSALLAAGFVEMGDPAHYAGGPHGRPLVKPACPLLIELHDRPNWPSWLGRPPIEELFEAAVPSSLGVEGVLTLDPLHHALVVATHSWRHGPMSRIGDLVDVIVMASGLDAGDLQRTARRWGVERLWRTTSQTADAVLFEAHEPWALRTWARNLRTGRERTVFEAHLGWWLSGFSAVGARRGVGVMGSQVARNLVPADGETWGAKLKRTRMAVRNARSVKSDHDAELERARADR
jgi:Uncharacterised nucleotidyltransferase